jgi:hypothetical protein
MHFSIKFSPSQVIKIFVILNPTFLLFNSFAFLTIWVHHDQTSRNGPTTQCDTLIQLKTMLYNFFVLMFLFATISGRFLAELTKEVFSDLAASKYQVYSM